MQGRIAVTVSTPCRTYTLLIVDDDEGMRENLQELFESLGYRVLTAPNVAEALKAMEGASIDLVLTDYKMPGPTGVELIEIARRKRPKLRAILMTAFGDSFTEIESVRRGAIGYLNKPFEADEVAKFVHQILEPPEA